MRPAASAHQIEKNAFSFGGRKKISIEQGPLLICTQRHADAGCIVAGWVKNHDNCVNERSAAFLHCGVSFFLVRYRWQQNRSNGRECVVVAIIRIIFYVTWRLRSRCHGGGHEMDVSWWRPPSFEFVAPFVRSRNCFEFGLIHRLEWPHSRHAAHVFSCNGPVFAYQTVSFWTTWWRALLEDIDVLNVSVHDLKTLFKIF